MTNLVLPNAKIENIKMVVFDKDGTLIDVHHYWCSMIEFRAKFFVEIVGTDKKSQLYDELVDNMGIDLVSKKMKPEGPVGIKPRDFIVDVALETVRRYDNSINRDTIEDIFVKVDEYSKTKLDKIVKVLPGVETVLENLKKADIAIAVATTDLTKRASLAMEVLNIKSYFDDIIGADLVKKAKPNPDLVDYIIKKNSLSSEDVLVVGDSMADLGMASNAGCQFLAVKTGLYTDEFIIKSEYIIDNLTFLKVEI